MAQTLSEQSYPRLLAPKADGELLVWPEALQVLRQTWDNNRSLREQDSRLMVGLPARRLRSWMRRWLGHGEDSRPIIATGHQTELHHAGVWVKNVVIDSAANRIGAAAIHFAVDTDAPKHLQYRWPGGGMALTDDPQLAQARWSALAKAPSLEHVQALRAAGQQASTQWGFRPAWDDLFATLEHLAPGNKDLSSTLTLAQHATDRGLGLTHQTLVTSSLWKATAYLVYVYDICTRAEAFAGIYNQALTNFRQTHGITSPGRPMPDMASDGDCCEVPFWLDDLAEGQRQRATLTREAGTWTLQANGAQFTFSDDVRDGWAAAESLGLWLTQQKLRLTPRALSLTMFLRMFVVDQFVHGIGGGLYDQVTDAIIAAWYDCPPPAFAVATATLFFPGALQREQICLPCLAREGRRLQNDVLGERKLQLVREIAALPRRSPQRSVLFSQMHRELDEVRQSDPRLAQHIEQVEQARQQAEIDARFFDRELSYTLQSRTRLEQVIAQVNERFGV